MKKIKTNGLITSVGDKVLPDDEGEKDVLILDEKHFKFGFLNVAYSNVQHAEIIAEGPLLFKKYYLVATDDKRRYQFGPFQSKGFLLKLPLPFDGKK